MISARSHPRISQVHSQMRLVRATGEQPLRTDAAIGIAVPASGQVCLAVAHRVHLDRINARGVVAIHVDQMIG